MIRVLRLKDVRGRVGLPASTIYDHMKKGIFPKSISLGPKSKGWIESEIEDWIQDRIAERDK